MRYNIKIKSFLLLLFLGFFLMGNSQSIKRENLDLRPLMFKNFLNAQIYKTDGGIVPASVNYNTDNQSLIFIGNGQYMELTGLEEIQRIIIGEDVFVPIDGKIYQKTERDDIYISFSNRVGVNEIMATKKESGKKDARQASNAVTGIYMNQKYESPNDVVFVKNFFLKKGKKLMKIENSKTLAKAFHIDRSDLNSFVKEKEINFNSYHDIIELLHFLSR